MVPALGRPMHGQCGLQCLSLFRRAWPRAQPACFTLNRLSIAPAAAWAKDHPLCNATTSHARVPILGRRNMATGAVTLQVCLFGNRLAADGQHAAEQQPLPRKGLEIRAPIGKAATGDLSPPLPGFVVHRITASEVFTLRHIEPSAATVDDFRPAGETMETGATAGQSPGRRGVGEVRPARLWT